MKKYISAVISCLLILFICGMASAAEIPSQNQVDLTVANDDGVRFDDNGDNTYSFFYGTGGGLNAIKMTDDSSSATNKVVFTNAQSGTFYIMNTGGSQNQLQLVRDDAILMLAVNGTMPDDFKVTITASGYQWPISATVPDYASLTYVENTISETFTKEDFIYGPQIWKPSPVSNPDYPIYEQQDMTDTSNMFNIMFIDLYAGLLNQNTYPGITLIDNGMITVTYSFENLPLNSLAAFGAYAYLGTAGNQPAGVEWTNLVNKIGETGESSGYYVFGTSIPDEEEPGPIHPPVSGETVPMQTTGMPIALAALGILGIIGGAFYSKLR